MATLDDINNILISVHSSVERQTDVLLQTLDVQKEAAESQKRVLEEFLTECAIYAAEVYGATFCKSHSITPC